MKNFIIISLRHSKPDSIVFWRENNNGYTQNPFLAGVYSEESIRKDPDYYCDSDNVPVQIGENIPFPMKVSALTEKIKQYQIAIRKELLS